MARPSSFGYFLVARAWRPGVLKFCVGPSLPKVYFLGAQFIQNRRFCDFVDFFSILSKTLQNSAFYKGKNSRFRACPKLGICTTRQLRANLGFFDITPSGRSGLHQRGMSLIGYGCHDGPSPQGVFTGGPNSQKISVFVILLTFFDFVRNFAEFSVLQRKT